MDAIKYLGARERRFRTNGGSRSCEVCGESRVFALGSYNGHSLCYEHGTGRAWEEHHIGGLHRGPAVMLRSNDHRVLTAKVETMVPARLRSRGRSPEEQLLALAIGAALASDHLMNTPGSPLRARRVRRGDGQVVIPLRDVPVFRDRHPSGLNLELAFIHVSMDD